MRTDSLIGAQVAKYRIEALLGEGGMSRVYLAEHLVLERRIALKLLAADLAADESFRERFLYESRTAAGIDHPNVIEIYDAGDADGLLYIAMRYVDGSDLRRIVKEQGALPPERTLHLLGQAAAALDVAHARGLVHRDVKPANILVGARDHAYLSDFGVAKYTADARGLTRTGFFVGTLDYAAPEQIKGEPLDGRADVYALGCILYQCLSGGLPFPRDSEVQLLYAHLEAPPPSLAETGRFPERLDRVIATALAKRREDRYANCAELIAAARAELGEAPGGRASPAVTPPLPSRQTDGEPPRGTIADRPVAWTPPPAPPRTRRTVPKRALVVVAALLAVAAAGAAWLLFDDGATVLDAVRGRVVDARSGKPIVGARVTAEGKSVRTGRTGRFTLNGITAGSPVAVSACAYRSPNGAAAAETLTLKAPRNPITGRATSDLTGAGVRATVRSGGRSARAGADGRYSFWGPCPGDQLRVSAPDHAAVGARVGKNRRADVVLTALAARDDFQRGPGLFDTSSSRTVEVTRKSGMFHVRLRVAGAAVAALQPIRSNARMRDVSIAAAGRRLSGSSADDSFGVFCRWGGTNRYYLFEVSVDGFSRIEKTSGGKSVELRPWLPTPAVRRGAATNRLSATCTGGRGTRLTFVVNGVTVASVRDPKGLAAGGVGVAVASYKRPGSHVVFDNVLVRRL